MTELAHREFNKLSQLQHPNVVQMCGMAQLEHEGERRHAIVMEYMGGGSLSAVICTHRQLGIPTVVRYSRDILQGLEYVHQRGLIHADIKPGNILLDSSGRCKLSDFGLARNQDTIHSFTNEEMKGTIRYTPPELLTDKPLPTTQGDVWMFGLVVFEMLTGDKPWKNAESVLEVFACIEEMDDTYPILLEEGGDNNG
eukprot:TRINITY_DN57164_c0_g2_i1.p1 TRINITY_DN57164_c0_g2~~TRINITY_DN57164_c0_g2_i1.p1  ORF type:complete len:214 (+),score=33.52 TRINITY_DN57164_c0_g2_i1:53-643(+)